MKVRGTVKWYNTPRGYGFISPEDGGPDVMVGVAALERSQLTELVEGQMVKYDMQLDTKRNKTYAINIEIVIL